jgi:hypothetical protein
MRLLTTTIGFAIATIGAVGVLDPPLLLDLGRSLEAPSTVYVVAVIRVLFGFALLWVAPTSRLPLSVRVIGILVIVAGVLGPFYGAERASAMLELWEAQGPPFMRAWAGLAVAFGLFIVYAVTAARRPAA